MTALQLVKGKSTPQLTLSPQDQAPQTVDLLVDGMNLTARVPDADVAPLLRDLAIALRDIATLRTGRVAIRCYSVEGPWELGLERVGDRALLSLFRGGKNPEVAVFERNVELGTLVTAVLAAIDHAARAGVAEAIGFELAHARSELARTTVVPTLAPTTRTLFEVVPETEAGVRFSAVLQLRDNAGSSPADNNVERADLFGLLMRGTLSIGVGDRTRTFHDKFVFLFAEQLLSIAAEVLDAWEQGRSYYRRQEFFGVLLGIRLVSPRPPRVEAEKPASERESGLWLTLAEPRPAPPGDARTFRLSDGSALVEASIGFGRALARVLLRQDPAQKQNLRLSAFRRLLRSLDDRLREATCDDAKVNPAPELYRAFAAALPSGAPPIREASKLRFSPGWTVAFPAIDLRSTFLCGDHLIVGGTRETACVDRRTGDYLWRRATAPALSVVTPLGLARLLSDGSIALHDFASGDVVMATRLAPRVGGVVTGAVVSAPGLPRLLVVSEGKRHLSAIDLQTGEVRWRHTTAGGAVFRLRRAGKLLVVAAGDATLTALDLASGGVVWRTRDRLRFVSHVGLDHESLFATAGEPDGKGRGAARLYHLDPYAGVARWARDLPEGPSFLGAPLVSDHEVVLVTRDRRGLGLLALDRATGETAWSSEPGLFPVASAWLSIDDAIVISSESGDLVSLSTRTGEANWRHRFPRGMEGDQPRKLEPILRSGALFVPQQQVHVVRPSDGALLGRVPTELIPDLLRVDEQCDVYVAEESGHLASFRSGAKLSLV